MTDLQKRLAALETRANAMVSRLTNRIEATAAQLGYQGRAELANDVRELSELSEIVAYLITSMRMHLKPGQLVDREKEM